MIRAHNKIFRACQDNPAGHNARRAKKRQTEKEKGGQHPGMDWHDAGRRHEEGWEAREIEGAGCQVIYGTPAVHQTTGEVKVNVSYYNIKMSV